MRILYELKNKIQRKANSLKSSIEKKKKVLERVSLTNYILSKFPYYEIHINRQALIKRVMLFLIVVSLVANIDVNSKNLPILAQQAVQLQAVSVEQSKEKEVVEQQEVNISPPVIITQPPAQQQESQEEKTKDSKKQTKKTAPPLKLNIIPETEVLEIKEKARKYKELLEGEHAKTGIIRKIYVNTQQVFQVNTAVNYATFLCFFSQFSLSDVVLGASIFDVDLYEKGNCLILFPKSQFKNTNLTVFLDKKPYHFILKEVSNNKEADFRVDVEKAPDSMPDLQTLIRMLYREKIFEPYLSNCRFVKSTCKEDICKGIDVVLEVIAPVYLKGFKIDKQKTGKKFEPLNVYYMAETDGHYYIFTTEKSAKVKINDATYEIY